MIESSFMANPSGETRALKVLVYLLSVILHSTLVKAL
jgi:hypothetical protein